MRTETSKDSALNVFVALLEPNASVTCEVERPLGKFQPIFKSFALHLQMGLMMGFDNFRFNYDPNPIREENLHLPEAVIESYDQDLLATLHPVFDLVWNACNIPHSLNFDKDGNWISK